jgi:MFS family permease
LSTTTDHPSGAPRSDAGSAPAPPDRRTIPRPAAFWLVAVMSALMLFSVSAQTPMYVVYQQRWGFSDTMITVTFAVYALFVLVSMVLFGSLSDSAGRRPVLGLSFALLVVAMIVFAAAQNVGWLMAGRAIQGIAVGIATGPLAAALIELAPPGSPRRGPLAGSVSPPAGLACGSVAAGLLLYGPWPTVLCYILLLAVFLLALGVVALLPETAPNATGRLRFAPRRVSVPREVRRPFAVVSLTITAVWSVGGVYLSLGPTIVSDLLHSQSHLLEGVVVTSLAGCGALAQLLIGHRLTGGRPILLGGALMFTGLGLVLLALSQGWSPLFFGGSVVLGLGWGSAFMGAFRMMAALAPPARRGEVLGAVYLVGYLAMSLPNIAVGIAVRFASLLDTATVFIALVGAVIVAALAGLPMARPRAARQPGPVPQPQP